MDKKITIVGLGEALWDLLPDGKKLGGAPLNMAYQAHQLLSSRGGKGIVASRIGADELGDEILAQLSAKGLPLHHVQRDPSHPTGTVQVHLDQGQPRYEIIDDVAWDHLEFTPALAELAGRCDAVCFGSLAQRSPGSRQTIGRFLDAAPQAIRLFDVNLRQQFFNSSLIDDGCRRATMVKLNEEELPVIAELLRMPAGAPLDQLAQLQSQYHLQTVVYTRGQQGTLLYVAGHAIDPPAVNYPAAPSADAVGAGDACSAAILAGWTLGLPPARIAHLANHAGAFVASQPGATPTLPSEIIALLA